MERITAASATIASSLGIGSKPAALARATLASLRPASEVITRAPRSRSRRPTPLPISPGAMTATVTVMGVLRSAFHDAKDMACEEGSRHLGGRCLRLGQFAAELGGAHMVDLAGAEHRDL